MPRSKQDMGHLPLYGVGPIFAFAVVGFTVLGIVLSKNGLLPSYRIESASIVLRTLGLAFILGGVALWLAAVVGDKIDDNIVANKLVTSGAYAIVRNPIYAAFLMVCTGVLLVHGNLVLLMLPFAYWLFLTILMKATEEKWLLAQYGDEYANYCARVNRCIPWFPRR